MKFHVVLAVMSLTSTMMLGAVATAAAQDSGIEIGAKAPGVALETLDGKPANLAQYVGKTPVLIEFWATWCPNCRELEPTLKAVHTKYASQVKFVGVSVSVNQSPERVKAYVAKHEIPGDQLFDRNGAATGAYDVPATSYVVVLDKSGKVVYTGLGGDQDLEKAIKKALSL
ncbi:MAG: TlpA family protein disulfide reductase [Gemmatimonadaceae bacterium]